MLESHYLYLYKKNENKHYFWKKLIELHIK